MRMIGMLPGAGIGFALALAACSGEADAQAEDAAAEDVSEAGAETGAEGHDGVYAEDETGGQVGADIVDPLNETLADFHAESGRDVHLILAMSTEGRDVEAVAEEQRAARDADALIYVAGADQALAIVGQDLEAAFTGDTELAMIAHFEENELAEGLTIGVDAVIARLSE